MSPTDARRALETASGDELTAALVVLVESGKPEDFAAMRARLDALAPEPWSKERYEKTSRIELALFASSDREAIVRAILDGCPYHHRGCSLEGLVLCDDAVRVPFGDNPWGIAPDAPLRDAVASLWEPLSPFAPEGVRRLPEELIGLALLRTNGGAPALAYLGLARRDRYEIGDVAFDRPPAPRERPGLVAWAGRASLHVVIGTAPRSKSEAPTYLIALPRGLEALFAIHPRLADGMWRVSDQLVDLRQLCGVDDDERRATFLERAEGSAPEDLHVFHGYGDDASDVLDMDTFDADGRPMVRRFYGENWSLCEPETFGTWLEERIASGVLKDNDRR